MESLYKIENQNSDMTSLVEELCYFIYFENEDGNEEYHVIIFILIIF